MRNPAHSRRSTAQVRVLFVGGCHGTCLLLHSDSDDGAAGLRQLWLGNAVVLTISLAIVAIVGALVWS